MVRARGYRYLHYFYLFKLNSYSISNINLTHKVNSKFFLLQVGNSLVWQRETRHTWSLISLRCTVSTCTYFIYLPVCNHSSNTGAPWSWCCLLRLWYPSLCDPSFHIWTPFHCVTSLTHHLGCCPCRKWGRTPLPMFTPISQLSGTVPITWWTINISWLEESLKWFGIFPHPGNSESFLTLQSHMIPAQSF